MKRPLSVALLLVLIACSMATAGTISIPFSFSPNTTIQSSQVNQNFATIYNEFNGGISDANVNAITETKVTFTGTGHDHSGGAKGMTVAFPVVQGQLRYASATQIKVSPLNGNRLYIKKSGVWTATTISSSGITANNTNIFLDGTGASNLAADTTYYVYLFDNSGTTTIDFSATGHTIDATTGLETKTGVDTRVLVGMVRTNGSSQFSTFLVLSYYNRALRNQQTTFSADRSTTSATYVELNSEIRNTFLTWGDESVSVAVSGSIVNSATDAVGSAVAFDGTSAETGMETSQRVAAANVDETLAVNGFKGGLAEGYHYATIIGKTPSGTATYRSATGATSAKVGLHIKVRG